MHASHQGRGGALASLSARGRWAVTVREEQVEQGMRCFTDFRFCLPSLLASFLYLGMIRVEAGGGRGHPKARGGSTQLHRGSMPGEPEGHDHESYDNRVSFVLHVFTVSAPYPTG